jgi:hypothetical protein
VWLSSYSAFRAQRLLCVLHAVISTVYSDSLFQLLVYADDVNVLGDNTDTIKKNTETLIYASNEVGLEVNAEKTIIYYFFLLFLVG